MKSSFLSRNPLLALFVALSLVFSAVMALVPTAPVQATATGVIINQPTTANVTITKGTLGTVTVKYYIYGTGASESVEIFITNGTTTIGQSGIISKASDNTTLHSTSITIPSAAAGNYYVVIRVNTTEATASQAGTTTVIIDNTAPTVSLILPNASSCWKAGSQNVQWAATDAASADNVTMYAALSINSGSTYPYSILNGVSYAQGAQNYVYTVPGSIDSAICKVTMWAIDNAGNVTSNTTSPQFSILSTAPTPIVTSPNGGETWNGGSSQTITGTITGAGTTVYYMLGLEVSGVNTDNITSGWQTATLTGGVYNLSYSWTVLNTVRSSNCKIILWARDCAWNTAQDKSDAVFSIKDVTAPTCTVTAPTTGATWYCSTSSNITWTCADNVPGNLTCTLYYTTDGGANYFLITSGSYTQSSNYATWAIPAGVDSNNCKIKITATDGETPANTGTGYSGTFTIRCDSTPPTITLCTPNGGESWQVGSLQSITWTCSDSPDATARMRYLIQLSTDGGGTYPTTIADLSNQTQYSSCGGSFSWPVPNNVTTQARIKITAYDPATNSAFDASDANFTITAATCAVETASITLYQGWNLISLPIWPTTTNINSLMSGIMPNITSVWYYSGGASGTWYSWAPGAPSTLTTIEGGKAYWFNMAAGGPYTLTFQGRKCPCPPSSPTTFSISTTGWNMVGFKSTVPKAVSTYFTSLGTCGTAYLSPINGYDGATQIWTSVNCSANMTVSSGYWVYINTTGTVSPGCD
jgi:hypothetical protein